MQGIILGFFAFSGSLKLNWKRGKDEKCTKAKNKGHAAAWIKACCGMWMTSFKNLRATCCGTDYPCYDMTRKSSHYQNPACCGMHKENFEFF